MSSLRILLVTSVVLSAVALSAAADTQAFKCTAEDGKISYLDVSPTTGCVTIEKVRINVGKGTAGETQTTGADNNGEPGDKQYDKDVAEKEAQMKKDCDTKKANLQTLKTNSNVQTKGDDGKPRRMTAEEQVKMTKDIQDYIDNFCTK